MKTILIILMAVIYSNQIFAQFSWEPNGSIISFDDTKTEITVKNDWQYLGKAKSGDLLNFNSLMSQKTITCDCTGNGSCMPFTASGPLGSTSGCAGECSSCSSKQTSKIKIGENEMESGGYYNLNLPLTFMKDGDEQPAVFEELFNLQEFQNVYNQLIGDAYGNLPVPIPTRSEDGSIIATDNHLLIGVVIFGRAMIVMVPKEYAGLMSGGTKSASCACTAGECSLHSKSIPLLGSATWCEGSCSGSCTLTTSKKDNYHIKITSYAY